VLCLVVADTKRVLKLAIPKVLRTLRLVFALTMSSVWPRLNMRLPAGLPQVTPVPYRPKFVEELA